MVGRFKSGVAMLPRNIFGLFPDIEIGRFQFGGNNPTTLGGGAEKFDSLVAVLDSLRKIEIGAGEREDDTDAVGCLRHDSLALDADVLSVHIRSISQRHDICKAFARLIFPCPPNTVKPERASDDLARLKTVA